MGWFENALKFFGLGLGGLEMTSIFLRLDAMVTKQLYFFGVGLKITSNVSCWGRVALRESTKMAGFYRVGLGQFTTLLHTA